MHGKRPVIKGIRLCGRQSAGIEDFPVPGQTAQKAVYARPVDKQAYKSRGGDSLGRLHCRAVYARLWGRNGRKWFFHTRANNGLEQRGTLRIAAQAGRSRNKEETQWVPFLCRRFCLLRKAVALPCKNRLGKEPSLYQEGLFVCGFPQSRRKRCKTAPESRKHAESKRVLQSQPFGG